MKFLLAILLSINMFPLMITQPTLSSTGANPLILDDSFNDLFNITFYQELAIGVLVTLFNSIFDINDPGSIIMILFNLLPIVGSNALPLQFYVIIVSCLGVIVAYYRGWI